MSTLRTDNLQTTDSAFTIAVEDLASASNTVKSTDLASTADIAKGAGLVGLFGGGVVQDFIDKTLTTKGAYLVGWIRAAAGAVGATVGQWMGFQPVNVLDFMTDAQRADVLNATGALDLSVPLQAARDYIASSSLNRKLVFPAGVYNYSVSPNWALSDAQIMAEGEVRLRYTGVGNAVIIDAGTPTGNVYNLKMGHFIVEAPSTAQNGVYVRSVHHSQLGFRVLTAGATFAGIRVDFAVCTKFDNCSTTGNVVGFYTTQQPKYGLFLDRRGVGETVSYCQFENPIFEVVDIGVHTDWTLGNTFQGGTFEACITRGMETTANSLRDVYDKVDFEANGVRDIVCLGRQIEFRSCDTTLSVFLAGSFNRMVFGNHETIEIDASAVHTTLENLLYRRNNTGSLINNAASTCMRDLVRVNVGGATFRRHNSVPARLTPAVNTGTFIYTNNTGNDQTVSISGGTVTGILLRRDTVATTLTGAPADGGTFLLSPEDSIEVANSVAPAVIVLTR